MRPYLISFEHIFNQVLAINQMENDIDIFIEKRGKVEDFNLYSLYSRLNKARKIESKIESFALVSKKENLSGSQLADLVVSPIGRHFINKYPKINQEILYSVVKEKFFENDVSIFP